MDFNRTVDLIIRDLEEAREIIDDLKNYPGVPNIQIEIAKAKCRNAAEVIALLKDKQDTEKTEDGSRKTEDRRPKIEDGKRKTEAAPAGISVEKSVSREPAAGIVADTFDNIPDSLNEKLGTRRDDRDVTDFLKSKPLANLSQAIGVNDRFLFIREIFNGNSESYSQAIIKIDEAKNLGDAKALMLDYAGDNFESEAGKQLFDLIKRKFPGDE